LIDRLVEASIDYLNAQIEAGVHAVQIFDSWAGILPSVEFRRWCLKPLTEIVAGVRRRWPQTPIIAFPRGANPHLLEVAHVCGADVIGLDTSADLAVAAELQRLKPVQGNLDPLVLVAGGAALDHAVDDILASLAGGAVIFNLGHGILPQTPIAHVEQLIRRVRGP
jgi:uroporphyrinogen decarboxylase